MAGEVAEKDGLALSPAAAWEEVDAEDEQGIS